MINAKEARSQTLTDAQYWELNGICEQIRLQVTRRNERFIVLNGISSTLIRHILEEDLGFTVSEVGQDIRISW